MAKGLSAKQKVEIEDRAKRLQLLVRSHSNGQLVAHVRGLFDQINDGGSQSWEETLMHQTVIEELSKRLNLPVEERPYGFCTSCGYGAVWLNTHKKTKKYVCDECAKLES